MSVQPIPILLADDDDGDRLLFEMALCELPLATDLATVSDGEQLMIRLMKNVANLPHLLFLDINMPRKNGFECLVEIKRNEDMKSLPVIIFSTSDNERDIKEAFDAGADLYIVKPPDFVRLIKTIGHAINFSLSSDFTRPPLEKFVMKNAAF